MKKSWKRIAASMLFGGCVAAASGTAFADLIGGTYTTATGSTWPGSPVYTSLTNSQLTGFSGQGYPAEDSNADGAVLSELVTPSSSILLQAIAIDVNGMATFTNDAMSLHIYSLASGQAYTSGGLLGSAESSNNGVYNPYPGPDLLGGGAGLPFNSGGIASSRFAIFTLNNGTTNDNIGLSAGTTYAIEFWNSSQSDPTDFPSGYSQNGTMTWNRNSNVDPGGGMFAGSDTLINPSASSKTTGLRETISEEGLAGGAPRTAAIALYSVPEPTTLGLLAASAASLMLRRRKA
jgi:hypothetical protein